MVMDRRMADENEDFEQEDPGEPVESPEGASALKAQNEELEAKLLRVTADYQNYARRAQQSAADACQQQLMKLAKALLTPLDHFDHALAAETRASSNQSLLKGVEIVRDELYKVLEQFDIKRIDVNPGDEFDPVRHEAIQRVQAEGVQSGAVAQMLQAGYTLADKTLRPAKVVVAE